MQYIVLDLEWNQTYHEKAVATQKALSIRLRGEVIQIGAVKLSESLDIIGSYRITVKPRFYKKIHRHVMRLTGIDQAQLDHGVPLAEAMESFHRFCGDDAVFLTWGPDDLPMLFDNLRANKLEAPFMSRYYDMQPMFNRETDGEKRQRSLEFAMEHFGIEMNLPAHDALNDAYFTALVAKRLDIAMGVVTYDEGQGDYLAAGVIGDADAGGKGFPTPEALLADPVVTAAVCPICKHPLTPLDKLLHSRKQRYFLLLTCPEHGNMMLKVSLARNFNETWRGKYILSASTEEAEADYRRKLAEAESFASPTGRRRRPRRRSGRAPSSGNEQSE